MRLEGVEVVEIHKVVVKVDVVAVHEDAPGHDRRPVLQRRVITFVDVVFQRLRKIRKDGRKVRIQMFVRRYIVMIRNDLPVFGAHRRRDRALISEEHIFDIALRRMFGAPCLDLFHDVVQEDELQPRIAAVFFKIGLAF